jgi:hypothetical protein
MARTMILYGERPVTEFVLLSLRYDEILEFARGVTLMNSEPLVLGEGPSLQNVYIEPPFGHDSVGNGYGNPDFLVVYNSFALVCEVKPRSHAQAARDLRAELTRYHGFLHGEISPRAADLVHEVHEMIQRRRSYVISITRDDRMPPSLIHQVRGIDPRHLGCFGWASYSFFENQVARMSGILERSRRYPSHIWLRKSLA